MSFLSKCFALCGFAICAFFHACAPTDTAPAHATFDTRFAMSVGDVPFSARVAVFDSEKMRGLMFVENLPENEGMLFVNDTPHRVSYWMKNTPLNLDIAFFDKYGVLTEVKNLYANNLNSVKSSRDDIAFCLEMNAGWFKKNKVFASAKLDIKKTDAAISARKGK